MSRLFIGCRVRHSIRGVTGRVAAFDEKDPLRMTVGVSVDVPGSGHDGHGRPKTWESGEVVFDYPSRWIPILDQYEPADADFTASLDRILSAERAES